MNFKKIAMAVCIAAAAASAADAAGFEAGKGVANDLATGANERDVTFVERGGNNSYGWRSYDLAIGLTVLPWAVPNEESSVYGLRFDLGWGEYADTYGLDAGVFSATGRDFGGISATVFGNTVGATMKGVQLGLVNIVDGGAYGVQIGAVNFAGDLHGLQVGFLNFNNSGLKCFPLINAGF